MNARRILVLLLLVFAAYGAVIGFYAPVDPPKALDFIFFPATVIPVYLWYRYDANERNFQTSSVLGGAIILLSLVAVPYYLVRSRPSGAKGTAVLRFLGFVGICCVVLVAAALPFAVASRGS